LIGSTKQSKIFTHKALAIDKSTIYKTNCYQVDVLLLSISDHRH